MSVLLHLVVLGVLATWGGLTPMPPIDTQHVLRVQLASLPETLIEPEPAAVTPPPPVEPEPEPEVQQPEPTPPPRVEPEPILPPKTVPEEVPEPEVVEPEPRPQPPVREPEPETLAPEPAEDAAAEAVPAVTGPAVTGTDQAFPFDYYLRTVRNNIARKWQPKQLGFRGQAERSCAVHFVIGRGGQVSQVTLVRSSGVSLFDREALRAVKASRMPPLPAKFSSPSLGVTFTFTLQSGV